MRHRAAHADRRRTSTMHITKQHTLRQPLLNMERQNHMLEPNSHPTMFYSCIHQRQPMYLGMRQSFFFQTRAPKVFPMSFFFHTAKSLCVSPALTRQTQAPTVVSIWRCSMGYLGLAHPLASLLLDIQTESHQLGFNGHYDFRRLIAEAAYIEAIPNTVGREISEGV